MGSSSCWTSRGTRARCACSPRCSASWATGGPTATGTATGTVTDDGHGQADATPALTPNDPEMVRELLGGAGLADVAQVHTGRSAFGRWILYRAVRAA